MKKKKIFYGILLLGVVGFGCYWLFEHPESNNSIEIFPKTTVESSKEEVTGMTNLTAKFRSANPPIPGRDLAKIQAQFQSKTNTLVYQEIGTDLRHLDPIYDTPVDFYGKVVDENGRPIEGADVVASVSDRSSEGASGYEMKTDAKGLFSLTGKTGVAVGIYLSQHGYYTPKEQNYTFGYVDGLRPYFHKSNPSNPVVFTLKKKGEAEPLIAGSAKVPLPKDGTTVRYDFLTAKSSQAGQMEVQAWKSDTRDKAGRFDWKMKISVPTGGLQEINEEFAFSAPENGYNGSVEIDMPASKGKDWSVDIVRRLFVKFGEPAKYARIEFRAKGNGASFFMDYWVNPSGSLNLEYDEAIQPKQTVFE